MNQEISLRERIRLNLVAAMEDVGLNQVQLAAKLGISKGTVNNWIRGNNSPDVDMVPKICNVLGLAILDLYSPTRFESTSPLRSKKAPSISDGAAKIAKDYDKLDHWGKQAVRELTDTELQRMADDARSLAAQDAVAPPQEPAYIPLYFSAAAAGFASPILGEEYDLLELDDHDPKGADFAVRIQGDSMEPFFPDGSHVFCNRDPLAPGDVGVFSVDGEAVCKQYFKSGGMVYLFSLNRKRADADIALSEDSGRSLFCFGRVMSTQRFPLPHEA